MSALVTLPKPQAPFSSAAIPTFPVCRLTVEQYHRMLDAGILMDGDPIELVDGWLVRKMTKNPPHFSACEAVRAALTAVVRDGWTLRSEGPITLSRSEPEPDVVVARGSRQDYFHRHPGPADIALVVEVADSSLALDQGPKKRVYARERLVSYWLVNLIDRQIEVYTQPTGEGEAADFLQGDLFHEGHHIPVVLDGVQVGLAAVSDILPPE